MFMATNIAMNVDHGTRAYQSSCFFPLLAYNGRKDLPGNLAMPRD